MSRIRDRYPARMELEGKMHLAGTDLYAYFFGKTRERRYTVWRIARS